jgi:hypothetical protein
VAVDEVNTSTVSNCWQRPWQEVVNDFKGFPTVEKETAGIMKLAEEMGGGGGGVLGDVRDQEMISCSTFLCG